MTRTLNGTLREPLDIRDEVRLTGQGTSGGTVYAGGFLDVSGQLVGSLEVRREGRCVITGQLVGSLQNHGEVLVTGQVNGGIASAEGEIWFVEGSSWCRDGRTMVCLLYTSPSPRDRQKSRMPSSA